ncbi:Sec-independent protein translocase TatA [Desulfonispora thiosulfatigenes DSM 11270]|uniref:Sec-independent protein translocase protein TatA n=1 Tax=Desulfonispora thiosulfatigenes DSM 11270 TaxID=656914 RepID=A0A1W1URD1_DESTI|nr:twin-arginine translocase TatA/TatE family subunit [Desulfonispora thiosulfatigenes]SMB83264.1 Sec-independent protein translocase TatA [Desulfonispora thiosulfatigenes DSM 11270]
MFNLGFGEITLILIVALVIFGPSKLPEIGKSLGNGIKEFKKASTDLKQSVMSEANETEETATSTQNGQK